MTEKNIVDRTTVIGRGLDVWRRWAILIIVTGVALWFLGQAIGRTWMVWFPVSIALLLSTVLAPPVQWLARHRVPRPLAAIITMLTFLGLLGFVFSLLIPQIVNEAPSIATSATKGLTKVQTWLSDGPFHVSDRQYEKAFDTMEDWLKKSAGSISNGVFTTLGVATDVLVNTVLVLILTFLFIKDGHRFIPFVEKVGGRRAGAHLAEVISRAWLTVGGFIRTQALVATIDATLIGSTLAVVGVSLALPLAAITFFGAFIPIVGAFASGAIAVLVTLVTNGPNAAIVVLIAIVVVQQLEGNVLSPMLQGRSMNLHPAIILLAVTAGSSLFGITGAFLAVPTTAATAEVLRYLNEQIDRESGS